MQGNMGKFRKWYEHVPILVNTSHDGREIVLWKKQLKIDRTRPNVLRLNREENNNLFGGKQLIFSITFIGCL
jgi:hypothetical protein